TNHAATGTPATSKLLTSTPSLFAELPNRSFCARYSLPESSIIRTGRCHPTLYPSASSSLSSPRFVITTLQVTVVSLILHDFASKTKSLTTTLATDACGRDFGRKSCALAGPGLLGPTDGIPPLMQSALKLLTVSSLTTLAEVPGRLTSV